MESVAKRVGLFIIVNALTAVEAQSIGKCSPPVLVSSTSGNIQRSSQALVRAAAVFARYSCESDDATTGSIFEFKRLQVRVDPIPTGSPTACRIYRDDCAGGGTFTMILDATCGNTVTSTGLAADANCRYYCQGTASSGSVTGDASDIVTYAAAGSPVWTVQNTVFTKYDYDCVKLSWSAPDPQGSPITCYSVTRDMNADSNFVTVQPCVPNPNLYSQVFCGLSSPISYRFRVFATNRVGTSSTSSEVTVMLKNMFAVPGSAVTSYASAVQAGISHQVIVQAVDPLSGANELSGFSGTQYGSRIFVLRLLNPSKLDEITSTIEVPLVPGDTHYTTASNPIPVGMAPITASSADSGNGQYSIYYRPTIAGQYTMVVRTLEQGGLQAQYWDNQWFYGLPHETKQQPDMILDWERGDITGNAADFVTARWTGFIRAEFSEEYTFYVDADDHARLWIDDVLLFDKWDICCGGFWGRAVLSAGVYHYIKLEYRELTGQAHLKLYWSSFSQVKEPIPASRMYRAPAISGMPLSIDVTVGNLLPQNCLAYGHQLTQSSAGLPSVFYIQAKDTEGNNMTDSNGAVFVVQLATSGSTVSVVSIPLNESIGLYAVHYLLTKAGTYTVTIKSSNVDISNSGASLDVSPGPPAASTTVVTDGLAGAIDFMAGVPKVLRVTVKDV